MLAKPSLSENTGRIFLYMYFGSLAHKMLKFYSYPSKTDNSVLLYVLRILAIYMKPNQMIHIGSLKLGY